MKRISVFLMIVSACSILPQVRAVDPGVYSNIVGFHKLELTPGYNFVGLNFRNPEAPEAGAYGVQDLLDPAALTGGTGPGGSDRLILWDGASQQYVQLWLFDSGGAYPDYDGKWMKWDGSGLAENVIFPGDGFWLINTRNQPVEINFSGEVEGAERFIHAALDGYNLIASAWPVDIAVNDMDFSGLKGGTGPGGSDRLILWDAAGQEYIQLWLFDSGGAHPDYDGKWMKWDGTGLAENTVAAGTAVWIVKQTDDVLSEGRPF